MQDSEKLTNIPQLIDYLNNADFQGYKKVAGLLNIPLEDWAPYALFSEEKYTRNCVARTEAYELVLLCWEPGQITPVHCHNDQECWVHVVQGNFVEQRYRSKEDNAPLSPDQELHLMTERTSYMNDGMGYHLLKNSAEGRSMSLHLYAAPIDRCRIYNEELTQFEWRELSYHSMNGELVAAEV